MDSWLWLSGPCRSSAAQVTVATRALGELPDDVADLVWGFYFKGNSQFSCVLLHLWVLPIVTVNVGFNSIVWILFILDNKKLKKTDWCQCSIVLFIWRDNKKRLFNLETRSWSIRVFVWEWGVSHRLIPSCCFNNVHFHCLTFTPAVWLSACIDFYHYVQIHALPTPHGVPVDTFILVHPSIWFTPTLSTLSHTYWTVHVPVDLQFTFLLKLGICTDPGAGLMRKLSKHLVCFHVVDLNMLVCGGWPLGRTIGFGNVLLSWNQTDASLLHSSSPYVHLFQTKNKFYPFSGWTNDADTM